MKVVQVIDKENSAIGQIAADIERYLPHYQFVRIPIHPKRPEPKYLEYFAQEYPTADVIDFQYYKSALRLIDEFPDLLDKPNVLSHHNPYAIPERDWAEFDKLVVFNNEQLKLLPQATLIPHTVDIWRFPWNERYEEDTVSSKRVGMVAARIEAKKGVLPVAQACRELKVPFMIVGRVSDQNYYEEVMATGAESRLNLTDEELAAAYRDMSVLVVNSVDNFESGPLPVLEAMAVGVPVVARPVGLVKDIYTEHNILVHDMAPDDVDGLAQALHLVLSDRELRTTMRNRAWQSVKNRTRLRTALRYATVYREAVHGTSLVSVIIPTFNRLSMLQKVLEALGQSTYKNIEAVVCDDGSSDGTEGFVHSSRFLYTFPIKYVNTRQPDSYNLAKARNLGIIEAEGEFLLLLDDRYAPAPNAIEEFLGSLRGMKQFILGEKGGHVTQVENFAFCRKAELVQAGMFNERCEWYGGISQEFRNRLKKQGWVWLERPQAKAEVLTGTKNRWRKKPDIIRSKELLFKLGIEP